MTPRHPDINLYHMHQNIIINLLLRWHRKLDPRLPLLLLL
jgi:hypothetical protein